MMMPYRVQASGQTLPHYLSITYAWVVAAIGWFHLNCWGISRELLGAVGESGEVPAFSGLHGESKVRFTGYRCTD
jgi:hypothetical protein